MDRIDRKLQAQACGTIPQERGSRAVAAVSLLRRGHMFGFTLIEVMVAMFIFLVLMTAASAVFSGAIFGYRNARAVQRDTENVQYALNAMAKELRTSSIVDSSSVFVRFYDYSQEACILYRISGGNLEASRVSPAAPSTLSVAQKIAFCQAAILPAAEIVSTGVVTGVFIVISSSATPVSVGKVTASIQIAEGPKHIARLQTTVSLRDYGFTGL